MAKKRASRKTKAPYKACEYPIGTRSDGTAIKCTRQKGHSMWMGHSPNRRK